MVSAASEFLRAGATTSFTSVAANATREAVANNLYTVLQPFVSIPLSGVFALVGVVETVVRTALSAVVALVLSLRSGFVSDETRASDVKLVKDMVGAAGKSMQTAIHEVVLGIVGTAGQAVSSVVSTVLSPVIGLFAGKKDADEAPTSSSSPEAGAPSAQEA